MNNTARLVDCAEYDCGRTFATRSPQAIQYCPNCPSSACVPASAVDSLFLHNETGIQYRVVRGAGAKLVLTPEDGKLEHGMLEGGSLEHWLIIGENRPRFDEQDAKKGENPVRFGETV